MKSILFVDDEPHLLEGLRTRLHRLRSKWQMHFVDSGRAAIEAMQTQPFDVIVSDQRMPEMDGATLLHEVRRRWPQTVRVVLSGYAELDQTMRLVPVAHQYIAKPCDPNQLENVIERCLSLRVLLDRPALRKLVGQLGPLPTPPGLHLRLQAALENERTTIGDVARLVSGDTIVAAKLLQTVNSGFFRLPRRITTVEQAVSYLGLNTVRSLVASAEIFSKWTPASVRHSLRLDMLQEHATHVAAVAHALVRDTPLANDTLLAALLHDIGYWLLVKDCAPQLTEAERLAVAEGIPMDQAEQRVLGASHAEIGAYLLGIWGFPSTIVEAVAHHHSPVNVAQTGFDVLAALSIAHALTEPPEHAAFGESAVRHSEIEADYLDAVHAPFSWDEAKTKASACFGNGGSPT